MGRRRRGLRPRELGVTWSAAACPIDRPAVADRLRAETDVRALIIILSLTGKVAAVAMGREHLGGAVVLWFAGDFLWAYHAFVPSAQGWVRTYTRFQTPRQEVWLTIDDGPDPEDTPRILTLLARHGARATFFVVGEAAARHPELIAAIRAGGHEVAHHTQTHPLATFWCATPARVRRELDAALAVLREQDVSPTRFRPPAGIRNPWLAAALRARGLACIGWSVRGLERQATEPAKVVDRILRAVRPGAIVLLHEGPRIPPKVRVVAIAEVLARLDRAGFRCMIPEAAQLR